MEKAFSLQSYLGIVDNVFKYEFSTATNAENVSLESIIATHTGLKALHAFFRNPIWISSKLVQSKTCGEYLKEIEGMSSFRGSALVFLLSLGFEGSFFSAGVSDGVSNDEKIWIASFGEKERIFFGRALQE